jgi:hypothetical protein
MGAFYCCRLPTYCPTNDLIEPHLKKAGDDVADMTINKDESSR